MNNSKKQWNKPQLIVLVRGNPEESVLLHCKTIAGPDGDPTALQQSYCSEPGVNNCGSCQSRSGS